MREDNRFFGVFGASGDPNAITALTDGSGTTANGTAIDLGGALDKNAIITGGNLYNILLGNNVLNENLAQLEINSIVLQERFGGSFPFTIGTTVTKNPSGHAILNNISGHTVQHNVTGSAVEARVTSGTITSEATVTTQVAKLLYNDNGVGSELNLSLLANVFTDNTSAQNGIVYAGDYSATFAPNSLVTKAYVDANSASYGVVATYDSSGTPTFYADLSSAITASSSGDTVFLFSDITETGATEIILKNGVDINLNGFTYEMSNASTTLDAFTDNNVAVDGTIYNGVIKRSGASGNNAMGLHILNKSSKVKLEGVEVQSTFGYCIYNQGTIDGGKTSNTAGNFAIRNDGGRMSNLIHDGYGEYRQSGSNAEGYNIYSKASNYYGMFIDGGTIQNSYSESASNEAFFIQGGEADNCVAVSSATFGIRTNGAVKLNNCKGYSSTSAGIFLSSSGAKAYYCVGESTANVGILINNGVNNAGLYNCTGRSSASQGIRVDNGSRAVNCMGISTLNTTSGHGFDIRNNNDRVSGCYAEVTNAGAYGFNAPIYSPYIVNCTGRGMTTLLNIAGNSQTNTADAYGNVLLQ